MNSRRMSDDKIGRLSDDGLRWFQEDSHAEPCHPEFISGSYSVLFQDLIIK